jgi:hypothetical protein
MFTFDDLGKPGGNGGQMGLRPFEADFEWYFARRTPVTVSTLQFEPTGTGQNVVGRNSIQ